MLNLKVKIELYEQLEERLNLLQLELQLIRKCVVSKLMMIQDHLFLQVQALLYLYYQL